MENTELKPCPFCGSTDIRYSLKIKGHFDVRYHAAMYCNSCHCYGARTLTETIKHSDYIGRTNIERDPKIKQKAIDAWNMRCEDMNITKEIKQLARDIYERGTALDGIDFVHAAVNGADDDPESHFMRIARYLYVTKGYRKVKEESHE